MKQSASVASPTPFSLLNYKNGNYLRKRKSSTELIKPSQSLSILEYAAYGSKSDILASLCLYLSIDFSPLQIVMRSFLRSYCMSWHNTLLVYLA